MSTAVEAARFAPRDAAPSPEQFDRLMPGVESLFPVGERVDDKTWKGARPCFPDSPRFRVEDLPDPFDVAESRGDGQIACRTVFEQ